MLDGASITVTSTGIGGPSTAIAVEELCDLGVQTFIRVGTCGAMQQDQRRGDLVVAHAAVRDEGTTFQYAPVGWPAVADIDITVALREAAAQRRLRWRVGAVQSKDSFYGELHPARMPVADELRERWRALTRLGVLASEMECAALFTVAAARGTRAGGVLVVINDATPDHGAVALPEPGALPLDDVIDVAVDALRRLLATALPGHAG
jgi:uridine phosphorylase